MRMVLNRPWNGRHFPFMMALVVDISNEYTSLLHGFDRAACRD